MNTMDGSICKKNSCHLCCLETEMELTLSDISRLKGAGFKGFSTEEGEVPRLINVNGRCILLDDDNLCSAYSHRPQGCRCYPLIMDIEMEDVILDDYCPHSGDFTVEGEDVIALHTIITELEAQL